jgi:ParB-like chromosome segregation protein Spo0J
MVPAYCACGRGVVSYGCRVGDTRGKALMNVHPVAALFPMMTGQEFTELVADIKANGLVNPIIRQGDTLIDGRNRMAACERAGVTPRFTEFTGDDPTAFIISANIHRRHLKESQRAIIAGRIANMKLGDNQHTKEGALIEAPISQPQAAAMLNVSRASVQRAAAIERDAPELAQQVLEGKMSVHAAKKQIEDEKPKPQKKEEKRKVGPPCAGMMLARVAVMKLEEIAKNDTERQTAFDFVKGWITDHES